MWLGITKKTLPKTFLRTYTSAPARACRLISTNSGRSDVGKPSGGPVKPRPVRISHDGDGGGKTAETAGAFLAAAALITTVAAGFEAYARFYADGSVPAPSQRLRVAIDTLREALEELPNISDPDPSSLSSALPPWSKRLASRRYSPGSPTVILSLEGCVVDLEFDPKVGYKLLLRPGLLQLLKTLSERGAEVVLWSNVSDSSIAESSVAEPIIDALIKADSRGYRDFCAAVDHQAKVAKAVELATAHKEGRSPRAHLLREMYFDGEKREMYAGEVLGIAGVLGREHSLRGGDARQPGVKPVHMLGRPPCDVLLIDSRPQQAAAVPGVATLLLSPFSSASYAPDDPALDLAGQMLEYFTAAAGLEAPQAAGGDVPPPSASPSPVSAWSPGAAMDAGCCGGGSPGSSIGAFYRFLAAKAEEGGLMPQRARKPAGGSEGEIAPHQPTDETAGVLGVVLRMMAEERRMRQRDARQQGAGADALR